MEGFCSWLLTILFLYYQSLYYVQELWLCRDFGNDITTCDSRVFHVYKLHVLYYKLYTYSRWVHHLMDCSTQFPWIRHPCRGEYYLYLSPYLEQKVSTHCCWIIIAYLINSSTNNTVWTDIHNYHMHVLMKTRVFRDNSLI